MQGDRSPLVLPVNLRILTKLGRSSISVGDLIDFAGSASDLPIKRRAEGRPSSISSDGNLDYVDDGLG